MTKLTENVQKILDCYESESDELQANLARILMHGALGGSGKLVILPVDQGFEHGPARSFAINPDAYDPQYHCQLAIDAKLSAYAAPLGMLEAVPDTLRAQIPTILKLNSSNSLADGGRAPSQAITASPYDALRLGCSAIGYTIYPGSDAAFSMMEDFQDLAAEAKTLGLAVVLWSYPRGGNLSKEGETALDVCAYAAHMAALLGAHIIKVKPPTAHIEQKEAKAIYKDYIHSHSLTARVKHIVQSCFNGRRMVVFSSGAAKERADILQEVVELQQGGATGSIIGRNAFQRPRHEALDLLQHIIKIYKGESP